MGVSEREKKEQSIRGVEETFFLYFANKFVSSVKKMENTHTIF